MPKSFHLITSYLKEKRLSVVLGFLSLIGVDSMQLILPRIIRRVVDDLTTFHITSRQLMIYSL